MLSRGQEDSQGEVLRNPEPKFDIQLKLRGKHFKLRVLKLSNKVKIKNQLLDDY